MDMVELSAAADTRNLPSFRPATQPQDRFVRSSDHASQVRRVCNIYIYIAYACCLYCRLYRPNHLLRAERITLKRAASTDAKGGSDDTARGGGGVAGDKLQCSSSPMFLAPELQLEAVTKSRWRRPSSWGCATKRRAALVPAVCLAVAVAIVVLFAGGGMPEYSFHDAQDLEDIPPGNLTADHLLDGLLTADFSYRSCRSRYDFASYHKKKSSHKPSPYLIAKLRNQEALQKRCGPGTAAYKKALRRLDSGEGAATDAGDDDCRYLVNISFRGLGNRMLAVASAFLYAVLTERVLLVHWGKRRGAADLFCEPFPGATWLLPSPGWRSRLRNIDDYDGDTNESLGNMLQRGAAIASADGNLSWASPAPPPYVYLHLSGGYGFHDKLFYCGEHQRLLRSVPWLLMRTDSYLVPGLFLTPPFAGELDAMFPEKDAAFHHLGRYLFHPSNAAWSAVTSYYRSNLAGAGRRVGIQIKVFQKKQPPQVVLDQLLSCVRNVKLLPEITVTATNDTSAQPNDAVLVTSLSSWYSERIRAEYGGRIAGGVHQPSHEGEQRWGDASHDMRALSEIYLLSMSDVLVTSGFSTFGYVAQGLAGLQPWVMPRQSMWDEWKEGQAAEQPCRRALSVEPCFHSPSYYDCAAKRDVELDKVRPYIRRCEDISWGIKLVNESGSQW